MQLFVSPHNDDETLFGAFTIIRHKPAVLVVFDSFIQCKNGAGPTWMQRRRETIEACGMLGAEAHFLGVKDTEPEYDKIISQLSVWTKAATRGPIETVWAPLYEELSHPHHNMVSRACTELFQTVRYYATYTSLGKTKIGEPVPVEPEWIGMKLKALACYQSQIFTPNCQEHFLREQYEYVVSS